LIVGARPALDPEALILAGNSPPGEDAGEDAGEGGEP
jgi:hypothetical protein